MTCHPLNMDRDQLLRLAAADASIPSPLSATAPATDRKATQSTPALSIETQPTHGISECIASRCKRLRHANNVQRLRYLQMHRALATYSEVRDA